MKNKKTTQHTPTPKLHERRPAPYPEPCPCEPGEWYWEEFKYRGEIIVYQCQCEPGEWPCSAIIGTVPTVAPDYVDIRDAAIEKANQIVRAVNSHEGLLEAAKLAQEYLSEINYEGAITPASFALTKEKLRNVIAEAEARP